MSDDRSADQSPASHDAAPEARVPDVPREHLLLQQAGDVIQNLRRQMAELDRREQNVAAQSTAVENEQRRLRLSAQEFEDQIQSREEAIRQQEADLKDRDDKLTRQQEELDAQWARFEAQVAAREQQIQDGLASIDEELAAERESRRSAIEAEMLELQASVTNQREEWEAERAEQQAQFEAEAAERQEQLAALREELDAVREEKLGEIERREVNLQRKQVELEKRTRFHETHLNQLRRSLEQQQTDCDRENQQTRLQQVQLAEGLERHRHQLVRVRDRFTQREESIDRERHLIDDLRRTIQSQASDDRIRWEQERQAWEDECTAHRADMRRQQDMLALHAQNLEARRTRLDQLRDELEQTHRETLELRLVVEQVWAQLSQTFGEDSVRERVDQARVELVEGYEKLRTSLAEQQDEIIAAELRLTEQRDRFRHEREDFTRWMSGRELQLQEREELLQRDIQVAADRESEWRSTRERWTLEKIEAESVIRQLLEELDADLTRSTSFVGPDDTTGELSVDDDETPLAA